jgi:SAM-dependent methyltransferase
LDTPSATPHPWEEEAANWIAWARTPGHDVFPRYAPTFFEEILPAPRGRTLEVGCGEGRVARMLRDHGHAVVAVDASPTLVRHAAAADPGGGAYAGADATMLPFADETFDLAVAYNVLQAMTREGDMAAAVREVARILRPGGAFCFCVAHPMTDAARPSDAAMGELVLTGSYFDRREVDEAVTKDGLRITFHGWTYTFEDYARALADAGFVIERLREPQPTGDGGNDRWRRLPLFLFVRARLAR